MIRRATYHPWVRAALSWLRCHWLGVCVLVTAMAMVGIQYEIGQNSQDASHATCESGNRTTEALNRTNAHIRRFLRKGSEISAQIAMLVPEPSQPPAVKQLRLEYSAELNQLQAVGLAPVPLADCGDE